jgi:hypothetical protein
VEVEAGAVRVEGGGRTDIGDGIVEPVVGDLIADADGRGGGDRRGVLGGPDRGRAPASAGDRSHGVAGGARGGGRTAVAGGGRAGGRGWWCSCCRRGWKRTGRRSWKRSGRVGSGGGSWRGTMWRYGRGRISPWRRSCCGGRCRSGWKWRNPASGTTRRRGRVRRRGRSWTSGRTVSWRVGWRGARCWTRSATMGRSRCTGGRAERVLALDSSRRRWGGRGRTRR